MRDFPNNVPMDRPARLTVWTALCEEKLILRETKMAMIVKITEERK